MLECISSILEVQRSFQQQKTPMSRLWLMLLLFCKCLGKSLKMELQCFKHDKLVNQGQGSLANCSDEMETGSLNSISDNIIAYFCFSLWRNSSSEPSQSYEVDSAGCLTHVQKPGTGTRSECWSYAFWDRKHSSESSYDSCVYWT